MTVGYQKEKLERIFKQDCNENEKDNYALGKYMISLYLIKDL